MGKGAKGNNLSSIYKDPLISIEIFKLLPIAPGSNHPCWWFVGCLGDREGRTLPRAQIFKSFRVFGRPRGAHPTPCSKHPIPPSLLPRQLRIGQTTRDFQELNHFATVAIDVFALCVFRQFQSLRISGIAFQLRFAQQHPEFRHSG